MLAGGVRSCKDAVRTVDREAAQPQSLLAEFLSADKPDTSREKKESQLSNHLHQTVLWACLWSIFLKTEVGGWSPLWLLPLQDKWSWVVKKQAEHQEQASRQHLSQVPSFAPV